MQTITHYEVYQAEAGQWTMAARFTATERDIALAHARRLEEDLQRPVAVIEETEEMANAQFDVRVILRSAAAGPDIRVPPNAGDLGTRFFMIVLTGLALGAIALAVGAVVLARAGVSGAPFNLALMPIFLGASLLGGLLMFRLYVPVGLILWRAKDPEARRRTMVALAQGRVEPAAAEGPERLVPAMASTMGASPDGAPAAPAALWEDAAPAPSSPAAAAPVPAAELPPAGAAGPPSPAALSAELRQALIDRTRTLVAMFTDDCLANLRVGRPVPNAGDRLGFSLYLRGAAEAASAHTALDDAGRDAVVAAALAQSGLSPEDVTAFFADLEANGERPRYQRMIADGKAAIAGLLGDALVTGPRPTLTDLLVRWNDPLNQTGEAQPVTFLLTDIAGSTAMTSEIGNAGAQRVVRAHNAIARAATRAFRGREIKHTGDGMLMIFPDSTAAARAAIDIQQEAATFSLDNPAAPLAVRIGVHTGEAVFEGGEYYGPAVAGVNGICAAAAPGEICCSMAVRQKMPSSLRTETLGAKVLKGSATATEVFKVLWEPRRAAAKGVLEYRQIGAPPAAGAGRG